MGGSRNFACRRGCADSSSSYGFGKLRAFYLLIHYERLNFAIFL